MLDRVNTCALQGIEGIPLAIEVDCGPGLQKLTIVGLPDCSISGTTHGGALSYNRIGLFIKAIPYN